MNAMTEKDAKEKFCPMVLATRYQGCNASMCMAWRWFDEVDEYSLVRVGDGEPPKEEGWESTGRPWSQSGFGSDKDKVQSYKRPFGDRRRGYCGMATAVES